MASRSSAAGSSTGTGRRSLATNKFDGGVKVWYKEDRIIEGRRLMDEEFEESALNNMSIGRSWKGKGKGYPGEVCCFGEGGCPYRIIAVEVGTGFLFTDVIVICAWAVSDHDTYVDWLAKQRSNSFNILTTVIGQCQSDWKSNAEAIIVNGGGETKPMRNTTPEPVVQRSNSERRPSRWRPSGLGRAVEAPGRIETDDASAENSSIERRRFNWFEAHGSSIVRKFRKARTITTDLKLWKTLGRKSPPPGSGGAGPSRKSSKKGK